MAELEKLKRASVPELNQILGIPFKVLDDGFVRVIDYMGTDASIVQAARVSYGKGTKKVRQDRELIRYLMRHWHTSPFEMCEIKLHVRVPMDTWRQWIRHRTASVNEYSTRYSVAIDSQQMTKPKEWRVQGIENRQGSAGFIDAALGKELTEQEKNLQRLSREVYEFRLESAVAREQARKDLPLSTYTEAYWKIDLHNLLHFLRLRMDDKAQLEIRSFALVIGHEIVARWCPLIWESFLDYRMESLNLSTREVNILRECLAGNDEKAVEMALELGLLKREKDEFKTTLELRELETKLKRMGVVTPWR